MSARRTSVLGLLSGVGLLLVGMLSPAAATAPPPGTEEVRVVSEDGWSGHRDCPSKHRSGETADRGGL